MNHNPTIATLAVEASVKCEAVEIVFVEEFTSLPQKPISRVLVGGRLATKLLTEGIILKSLTTGDTAEAEDKAEVEYMAVVVGKVTPLLGTTLEAMKIGIKVKNFKSNGGLEPHLMDKHSDPTRKMETDLLIWLSTKTSMATTTKNPRHPILSKAG